MAGAGGRGWRQGREAGGGGRGRRQGQEAAGTGGRGRRPGPQPWAPNSSPAELVWGTPTEASLRKEAPLGSACHRPGSAAYLLCDKYLPLESLSFPF